MSSPLAEGALFAGRYRVLRCIATGGMGSVYEVIHLETQRRRALKVMLPSIVGSADLRQRFQREAQVAAHIDSEFIVDVFDAGVDEGTGMPFMVMELLRGEELGKRIERAGRLPPEEAIAYLHQTALALDKTHRANVVHRDLKPANLFLTEREDGAPRIKVLDFGIAKLLADGATRTKMTRGLGTPVYMAPEQFADGPDITPATDLYALGMVAYDLLVGVPYWEEELESKGPYAFVVIAMTGPTEPAVRRAARRGVALPPGFDAWFTRATAVDPGQRFPAATAAVSALSVVFGQAPLPGALVPGAPRSPGADELALARTHAAPSPGASTRRRGAVLVAVLAMAATGIGAAVVVEARSATRPLPPQAPVAAALPPTAAAAAPGPTVTPAGSAAPTAAPEPSGAPSDAPASPRPPVFATKPGRPVARAAPTAIIAAPAATAAAIAMPTARPQHETPTSLYGRE